MSRQAAITRAAEYFDSGAFQDDLARRIAHRTESQVPGCGPLMYAYLREAVVPDLEALGFTTEVFDNPVSADHPFLVGQRVEDPDRPSVLLYGHGDVTRGQAGQWRDGLDPWQLTPVGDRWYGRGSADNKGQHTVNFSALRQVLTARDGRLGFNCTILLDMGEEAGSPGLDTFCATHRDLLAADLFLGSDGPRLAAERPTLFLGSRGSVDITLTVTARKESHHAGNWGGVLRNPATVISHALASMVDGRGAIRVEALRPPAIPPAVRNALSPISVDRSESAPNIDEDWGEPGLSVEERLFGWNTLEILAMTAGTPEGPVGAIPGQARAWCQLRFVVGTDTRDVARSVRDHLTAHGISGVDVTVDEMMGATRLDPENTWVTWAMASVETTTRQPVVLLPNLGGSLPNSAFADTLGLPTIWVPHSYPGCAQHAPDEHALGSLLCQALQIMAGLFWDLGDLPARSPTPAATHAPNRFALSTSLTPPERNAR